MTIWPDQELATPPPKKQTCRRTNRTTNKRTQQNKKQEVLCASDLFPFNGSLLVGLLGIQQHHDIRAARLLFSLFFFSISTNMYGIILSTDHIPSILIPWHFFQLLSLSFHLCYFLSHLSFTSFSLFSLSFTRL
jgi:hypothetical protein